MEQDNIFFFPCECGHEASEHWWVGRNGATVWGNCCACNPIRAVKGCQEYKKSNLVYLEQQYEAKQCQ
jgi:hypothetical protein